MAKQSVDSVGVLALHLKAIEIERDEVWYCVYSSLDANAAIWPHSYVPFLNFMDRFSGYSLRQLPGMITTLQNKMCLAFIMQ